MGDVQISAGAAVAAIAGLSAAIAIMWAALLGKIKAAELSCAEDRRLLQKMIADDQTMLTSMLVRVNQLDRRQFNGEPPAG